MNSITLVSENGKQLLKLIGEWTLERTVELSQELSEIEPQLPTDAIAIDGSRLELLDTAGGLALIDLLERAGAEVRFQNLKPEHKAILELVYERKPGHEKSRSRQEDILRHLGRETLELGRAIKGSVAFIGEFFVELAPNFVSPKNLRVRELFVQLELAAVKSIPVIILVNFLIGLVVAFIFADQAKRYGANIFVVDGVSIAISRELAPLIVAIVMAGRSGSAFTAQIGSMKINQELDAIQTLGLSLMDVIVIPRVLALMVALPLLYVLGTAVGLLGGLIVTHSELGITPVTFLNRVQDNVAFRHFVIGFSKAPIFAMFIALIGCRMGLTVENNTTSVGLHTTSTVVQSIVVVIIIDALFAVLMMKLGL